MSKETGGPAFPHATRGRQHTSDGYVFYQGIEEGMTLRDFFAAHAIHAATVKAIHNFKCDGCSDLSIDWDHIAESAYDAADAMIEARSK